MSGEGANYTLSPTAGSLPGVWTTPDYRINNLTPLQFVLIVGAVMFLISLICWWKLKDHFEDLMGGRETRRDRRRRRAIQREMRRNQDFSLISRRMEGSDNEEFKHDYTGSSCSSGNGFKKTGEFMELPPQGLDRGLEMARRFSNSDADDSGSGGVT